MKQVHRFGRNFAQIQGYFRNCGSQCKGNNEIENEMNKRLGRFK